LSVSGLKFREPYPIYRALRVPLWEGGRPVSVRRVTDDDRKALMEALSELRSLLERLLNLARDMGEEEKLELIADAIVMFLKAPLVQEVSPAAPTPLKAHVLTLLPRPFVEVFWDDKLHSFVRNVAEKVERKVFDAAKELFQPETANLVFKLWIFFPADTRPGHNTSSLIAHSLMTSAIAWALNHRADRRSIAKLRLVALLHDLGKALDPQQHFEASKELAKRLLEGLMSDVTLNELLQEIEKHHVSDTYLRRADYLASAADRLNRLVRLALKDRLQKIKEVLGIDRTEWDWDFWIAVHERRDELIRAGLFREDPFREMTEEFLRKVDSLVRSQEYRKAEPFRDDRISLVLIDFASIQEYVRRGHEIRVVAAASHVIELAVHAHLLWYLRRRLYLPPEAVLYSGGGNVLLLVPSEVLDTLKGTIKEYGEDGLELKVAHAHFTDDYVRASEELAINLYREKHKTDLFDADGYGSAQGLFESGSRLCQICYDAWATDPLETPARETKEVCGECLRLYKIGSDLHFGVKWKSDIKIGDREFRAASAFEKDEKDWSNVSRWVMEVIAGHDPEELEKGTLERRRDYAVVKFDGNAMGRFMMESVSFTDAVERSFRVDVAMKRAYMEAMEALYDGVKGVSDEKAAEKEVARVFLGTIYMGGDDGFLLMPSWASLPFAHLMAEEFSRQLGLERGLRVAVAVGSATMSVWSLLDCADEMMKRSKDVLRHIGRKLRAYPEGREEVLGAIAFDVFETGSPSGATVRERMERLSWKVRHARRQTDNGRIELLEEIDSAQPYLITRSDLEGSTVPELWNSVGKVVFDVSPRNRWSDPDVVRSFYVELFGRAYRISRPPSDSTGKDETVRWLNDVRNAVLRSWGQVSPSSYWREKLIVYFLRQSKRGEEELAKAYRALADLGLQTVLSDWFWSKMGASLPETPSGSEASVRVGPFPLADVLTLVKLVKGGAW